MLARVAGNRAKRSNNIIKIPRLRRRRALAGNTRKVSLHGMRPFRTQRERPSLFTHFL
jgi:hypothetical protein